MAGRGGKRRGAGRKAKPGGERVPVLVRMDRDLVQRIEAVRGGKSMSSAVERLVRSALSHVQDDDDDANSALGFVLGQAANASCWNDRTWRNDPATTLALKLAVPLIIDLLAPPRNEAERGPHPMFSSVDEHARQIVFWIINRLKERGDEYGTDWQPGHPLRNFPRAATALEFKLPNGSNKSPGSDK